jgi:hypothetical protein
MAHLAFADHESEIGGMTMKSYRPASLGQSNPVQSDALRGTSLCMRPPSANVPCATVENLVRLESILGKLRLVGT